MIGGTNASCAGLLERGTMFSGHVEHYSDAEISGWAANDEGPVRPAMVDILLDGVLFARLSACLPRRSREQADAFKLRLPEELRYGRKRTLVEVRFAGSDKPLGNSPRYIGCTGAAKRVLVMSPAGVRYSHDKVKARPQDIRDHIKAYINTGDWMVFDSSLKLLSFAEMQPVNIFESSDEDIERFNSEYDYAFLRGSNYIHENMDWRLADKVLSKLNIPVIAFAVGAQSPGPKRIELPDASVRVWKMFADHAASIGVRGTFSAEVLNDIGITNIDVIGCPSLFRCNDPFLKIRPRPIDEVRRVAFSLRREVSAFYASDMARYLRIQKQTIKQLDKRFDLTLTTHGEPAEKAFFYKDNELMERYHTQLVNNKWFDLEDKQMEVIYQNQLYYNMRVEDFDDFIKTQDLAMGFRVHCNLPAVANGVPAWVVDYDTRSRELADTFKLPVLTLDDLEHDALDNMYSPSLWDSFNAHYPEAYRRMAAFLDKNGVAHKMSSP